MNTHSICFHGEIRKISCFPVKKMPYLKVYLFQAIFIKFLYSLLIMSLGEAKLSCILHHRGVQLILAYSWARPAVLAAGKGRGGMFLLFLLFLHCH